MTDYALLIVAVQRGTADPSKVAQALLAAADANALLVEALRCLPDPKSNDPHTPGAGLAQQIRNHLFYERHRA